jgi:hypothetical protein
VLEEANANWVVDKQIHPQSLGFCKFVILERILGSTNNINLQS